jgi:hypothetical protein
MALYVGLDVSLKEARIVNLGADVLAGFSRGRA